MANLTITVPEEVLTSARRRALEQGTSVNALLRDYLIQYTGAQSAQAKAAERILDCREKRARAAASPSGRVMIFINDEVFLRHQCPGLPA